MDKIRNDYVRGTTHIHRFGDKAREARLRWFRHVRRREEEYMYVGRKMLNMDPPGRRKTKEKVYGYNKRYAGGKCDRGRRRI